METSKATSIIHFYILANENFSNIVGKGDVCLETNNGMRLVLKDVRHIPDMRLNMILTSRLDDEGFYNTFFDGKWKLTKGSLVVARGKKYYRLYFMKAKISQDNVNTVENDNTVEL